MYFHHREEEDRHSTFIQQSHGDEEGDTDVSEIDEEEVDHVRLMIEVDGASSSEEVDELPGRFKTQPLPGAKIKKR